MIDEPTEELASLYVLGCLTGKEAADVQARLEGDDELRSLVHELETVLVQLAHLAPPVAPSPAVRERLLAAVRARSGAPISVLPSPLVRWPHRWPWVPWALAAALGVAATILGLEAQRQGRAAASAQSQLAALGERLHRGDAALATALLHIGAAQRDILAMRQQEAAAQHELGAAHATASESRATLAAWQEKVAVAERELAALRQQDVLSQLRIAILSAQGKQAPGSDGAIAWDARQQRGIATFNKLPPAGPTQDYQLWIIDPHLQKPVSAGLLAVDTQGQARTVFVASMPIAEAGKFAVSRERKGGSPAPQGSIVLLGQ